MPKGVEHTTWNLAITLSSSCSSLTNEFDDGLPHAAPSDFQTSESLTAAPCSCCRMRSSSHTQTSEKVVSDNAATRPVDTGDLLLTMLALLFRTSVADCTLLYCAAKWMNLPDRSSRSSVRGASCWPFWCASARCQKSGATARLHNSKQQGPQESRQEVAHKCFPVLSALRRRDALRTGLRSATAADRQERRQGSRRLCPCQPGVAPLRFQKCCRHDRPHH